MVKFGNNYYLWLGAFCIFLIDQATKMWALNMLHFDNEVIINSLFSFHRIYNEAYIMLNYNVYENNYIKLTDPLQFKLIYASVSLILMSGIVWVTNQPALKEHSWPAEFSKTGLFIIMGGVLGNAYDRVFRDDGVIDFLRINTFDTIPIVNFADILIYFGEFCLMAAWLIVLLSIPYKKITKK